MVLWPGSISASDSAPVIRLATAMLVVALCSQAANAEGFWSQFVDPDDGRFDASSFLADNAYGFLPLPIIITDPAVDGGLGAAPARAAREHLEPHHQRSPRHQPRRLRHLLEASRHRRMGVSSSG